MAWSFTLNGTTWTDADFEPFQYAVSFPVVMQALGTVAALVDSSRTDAAASAATAAAAVGAVQSALLASVAVTGATAMTVALHNNRLVLLTGTGAPTLDYSALGAGFSTEVVNNRASDVAVVVANATLRNVYGHTRIRGSGGVVQLITYAEGGNGIVHMTGDTLP